MSKVETPKAVPAVSAEPLIGNVTATDGTMLPNGLMLTFSNGKELRLLASDLSPTIVAQAIVHGLKQKLVDAAAISRNPETGRAASVEDKFAAVNEVYERLLAGEWNKRREGESASGGLLLRALVEYTGKDAETLKPWLDAKTDAERAALRKNPKVAAIIATLRPVKDTGVDSDALLGELDD